MPMNEQEKLLAYTVEKVRTLQDILMGVVMADPSPQALRKSVEKYIRGVDASELYKLASDEEVVIAREARSETFASVFRGVPESKRGE